MVLCLREMICIIIRIYLPSNFFNCKYFCLYLRYFAVAVAAPDDLQSSSNNFNSSIQHINLSHQKQ